MARIQLILFAMSTALYLSMNGVRAQGTAFTYQGRLDVNGAPASGTYDFRFRLALDPYGNNYFGSSVLASDQVISNGLFTATPDFGAGAFNGGNYWLEVDVRTNGTGGYTALIPLQPVTPTPYAIFSGTSSNALNASAAVTATSATSAATANAVGPNGVNGVAIQNNAVTSPKIAGGQVVKSLTAGGGPLYDNVTLAAGNNVTITPSGQTVTIAASSGGWSLTGNGGTTPGVNFVGTADNESLELHVNGARAFRLEPDGSGNGAPNVIGGSPANFAAPGVYGASIGGGGGTNSAFAQTNSISANFGTIAGGEGNTIQQGGSGSTIAGGMQNTIQGLPTLVGFSTGSTIGGGGGNTTLPDADYATIPGGLECIAGKFAFAAGVRAGATNQGTFVWADDSSFQFFYSVNANEFAVRATGGFRLVSSVDGNGNPAAGVTLGQGSSSWASISDKNMKKDIVPVNCEEVLKKLAQVPIEQWHYKWEAETDTPNIGPMAQDFKAAFYPGRDDKSITTLEFDGVELAAIQGLNRKLDDRLREKESEIEALRAKATELDELKERLSAVEQTLKSTHSPNQ
jgi:hypothetical protein